MRNARVLPIFIVTLVFSGVAAAAPSSRPTAPYGTQSIEAEYAQRMREMNAGLGFDLAAAWSTAPAVHTVVDNAARLASNVTTRISATRTENSAERDRASGHCDDDDSRCAGDGIDSEADHDSDDKDNDRGDERTS